MTVALPLPDGFDLRDGPCLVLDCQTSAPTPAAGHLLELGWQRMGEAGADVRAIVTQLPADAELPRKVKELTGLSRDALLAGEPVEDAYRALLAELGPTWAAGAAVPTVIHHAALEMRFLAHLAARAGEPCPFAVIDTHRIARRLLPDLPRCGLRALAGYLGVPLGPARRAGPHVAATAGVWRALRDALADEGVRRADDLTRWLRGRVEKRARRWPMPRDKRLGLPDRPGVYRLLRADRSCLYVGKAASLKTRVNGHFRQRRGLDERRLEMLTQARDLDWEETATATEAALREADAIKEVSPPYNVHLTAGPVAFLDRRFTDAVPRADAAHPVGPVRDPDTLLVVARLVAAMSQPPAESVLRLGGRWAPAREVEAGGLALFAERHGALASIDDAFRVARRLGPPEDGPDDGDAALDDEATGWTPEAVCDSYEDRLRDALLAVRRARWLCCLTESTVTWRDGPGRRRVLDVRGAKVVGSRWRQPGDAVEAPPARPLAADRRPRLTSRAAYDRLRVLTTELRRLQKDGCGPVVFLAGGARVEGDALGRLLAVV